MCYQLTYNSKSSWVGWCVSNRNWTANSYQWLWWFGMNISMKCYNSFSSNLINVIIWKIINKLVNGKQMWMCMLVAIWNLQQLNVSNAEASITIKWFFMWTLIIIRVHTESEKLNSWLQASCGIAYFGKLDQSTVGNIYHIADNIQTKNFSYRCININFSGFIFEVS